jgi:acid phosphatase
MPARCAARSSSDPAATAARAQGVTLSPSVARVRAVVGALATLLLAASGCAQLAPTPVSPSGDAPPSMYETQQAVTRYVDSGRYAADVGSVVAQAQAWLEQRAPVVARPAIVIDVDETALSNWAAYRVNGWVRISRGDCDLEAGPCNILAWYRMANAPALPATLALARRAEDLGVAVFFITGRSEELRDATERNLRGQGFDFERVILRQNGTFASAADFKAPARCALEREGYRIILSLGDQQSDLDGGCAERGFKLPNPVYFLP